MIEKYDITESIPIPHDCVITRISVEHDYLLFSFESELYTHESIQVIHPSANSLIMRFHLTRYPQMAVYRLYERRFGRFRKGYRLLKDQTLFHITGQKNSPLEYLYHFVGAREMIIHLSGKCNYVLYVCADAVEFNWIESQKYI